MIVLVIMYIQEKNLVLEEITYYTQIQIYFMANCDITLHLCYVLPMFMYVIH